MMPPKKKFKRALSDEKMTNKSESESLPEPDLSLLVDPRISWLLASEDKFVQVKAQGVLFRVHKSILTRHSDYFDACLNRPFREASQAAVSFDDIDPRYMALYLGVAYSFASIVPHPTTTCTFPGTGRLYGEMTPLRDYIEVYKLSDRFINVRISRSMLQCINQTIGARHSELFRNSDSCWRERKCLTKDPSASSSSDNTATQGETTACSLEFYESRQRALMREFADGFEALDMAHDRQKALGQTILKYFCGGVDYMMWSEEMEELLDRPRFVGGVSGGFARQLGEATGKSARPKRKELKGPGLEASVMLTTMN